MNHYTIYDIVNYSEDHEPLLKISAGMNTSILFKSFYHFLDIEYKKYHLINRLEKNPNRSFNFSSFFPNSDLRLIYASKMNSFIFLKKMYGPGKSFIDERLVFLGACMGNHAKMIEKHILDYQNTDQIYNFISEGLFGASLSGNEKLIQYLLGVELPEDNPYHQKIDIRKILYGAILANNYSAVEKLVEEHPDIPLNRALRIACEKGHISIGKFLMEKGANDLNGAFGFTCKGRLDAEKTLEIMKLLNEKGATTCQNVEDCQMSVDEHINFFEREIVWMEKRRKEGKSTNIIDLINEIFVKQSKGKAIPKKTPHKINDLMMKEVRAKHVNLKILKSRALREIRFFGD